MVARAQALAPFKSGALRGSIRYEVSGGGGGVRLGLGGLYTAGKTLIIEVGVPYGIFQEFGTRHIRPHPYIRPALNEIGRIFGAELGIQFNTPTYGSPVYAHQAGFTHPKHLTNRQKAHIATHLLPASKRHFKGNVKRAKLHVRKGT